jgi:hypothetical protein
VSAGGIVEAFYEVEHRHARLGVRAEAVAIDQLAFERCKEVV